MLETVVANMVRDIFDPLTQQIDDLTQRIEYFGQEDEQIRQNRPRISIALPIRRIEPFSRGFGRWFSEFIEKFKQALI